MRVRETIYSNLINQTGVGAGQERRANLNQLTARPNGKYAYVIGLKNTITGTFTETGTGQALEYEDTWDLLSNLTLRYANKVRFNAYTGRSLVRRMIQMDESLKKNIRDSYIKTADVAASAAGDTEATFKYMVNLCPWWHQKEMPLEYRLAGAISVADLMSSGELALKLKSNPVSSDGGSNYWSVDSSGYDLSADLHIVELDRPIVPADVEEFEYVGQEQTLEAPMSGVRRITGCLVADDENADLTDPTSFTILQDGDVVASGQNAADWVDLHDQTREENVNQLVHKALPIIGAASHGLEDCPVVNRSFQLQSVHSQHTGNIRVLWRVHKELDPEAKRQALRRMGVPSQRINQAMAEVAAPTGDASAATVGGLPATLADMSDPSRQALKPVVLRP